MKIYVYDRCSTCRTALRFLSARGWSPEVLPILEQPPTVEELRAVLRNAGGRLNRLFNTSGREYRAQNLGEKLGDLSEADALELLSSNGALVKRPLLIREGRGVAGFREVEWEIFLAH